MHAGDRLQAAESLAFCSAGAKPGNSSLRGELRKIKGLADGTRWDKIVPLMSH